MFELKLLLSVHYVYPIKVFLLIYNIEFQIKNHCFVFVNSLIVNPTFDSQTKENMTLVQKKFGSKCELTDNFLKSVSAV